MHYGVITTHPSASDLFSTLALHKFIYLLTYKIMSMLLAMSTECSINNNKVTTYNYLYTINSHKIKTDTMAKTPSTRNSMSNKCLRFWQNNDDIVCFQFKNKVWILCGHVSWSYHSHRLYLQILSLTWLTSAELHCYAEALVTDAHGRNGQEVHGVRYEEKTQM